MKFQLILFPIMDRPDRLVGADHIAHPAADTGEGRFGPLADAMIDAEQAGRFFRQTHGNLEGAHSEDSRFDGPDRTDRRATSAEGTLFLTPDNLPGQIRRA
jgi:hypothetical protein